MRARREKIGVAGEGARGHRGATQHEPAAGRGSMGASLKKDRERILAVHGVSGPRVVFETWVGAGGFRARVWSFRAVLGTQGWPPGPFEREVPLMVRNLRSRAYTGAGGFEHSAAAEIDRESILRRSRECFERVPRNSHLDLPWYFFDLTEREQGMLAQHLLLDDDPDTYDLRGFNQ